MEAESAKADSNELGLDNVGGVFVVLIAGTLAAFFMAILELLWNCRKIAVEEKVSIFNLPNKNNNKLPLIQEEKKCFKKRVKVSMTDYVGPRTM